MGVNFLQSWCVIAIMFAAFGCAKSNQTAMTNQHTQIAAAIQKTLSGPQGGFVIFEEKSTGKFVQFAGSSQEPLILDLPWQTLSEDEKVRARTVLAPHGGTEGEHGFQLNLDRDADRAAQITMEVFRDVYQIAEPLELKTSAGN